LKDVEIRFTGLDPVFRKTASILDVPFLYTLPKARVSVFCIIPWIPVTVNTTGTSTFSCRGSFVVSAIAVLYVLSTKPTAEAVTVMFTVSPTATAPLVGKIDLINFGAEGTHHNVVLSATVNGAGCI
jgi:hypothetical protein